MSRMNSNRSWSGPRALLTNQQAAQIYMIGQGFRECGLDPLQEGRSSIVSKKYGVSPKAIRDIWNRRTWQNETWHLWAENERPLIRNKKLDRSRPLFDPYAVSRPATNRLLELEAITRDSCVTNECNQILTKPPSMICSIDWLAQKSAGRALNRLCANSSGMQGNTLQPCFDTPLRTLPSVHAPPQTFAPPLCVQVVDGGGGDGGAEDWEGPFGRFPAGGKVDADPFHADWPYW